MHICHTKRITLSYAVAFLCLLLLVAAPKVSVTGVKIHRITPNSLKVSWDEISLHNARGTPVYHVSYRKDNATNVVSQETVEPFVVYEGLDSASVYSITIQVKTAGGMGPSNDPISG